MTYNLEPGAIRDVLDLLRGRIERNVNLIDELNAANHNAIVDGDVLHAMSLHQQASRLQGEVDAYGYAVAAIETRTRVGMEKVDQR